MEAVFTLAGGKLPDHILIEIYQTKSHATYFLYVGAESTNIGCSVSYAIFTTSTFETLITIQLLILQGET